MTRASLLALVVLTAACRAKEGAPVVDSGLSGAPLVRGSDSLITTRNEEGSMSAGKPGNPAPPLAGADQPRDGATSTELRGTVAVTGSDPGTIVTLRTASGRPALTLTGSQTALISRVSGAEIWVRGTREDARRFQVSAFGVRSVDGVPAVDGILMKHGDSYMLETSDGKHLTIARLPSALADKVGARIWLSGPLDRDVNGFGVIDPP